MDMAVKIGEKSWKMNMEGNDQIIGRHKYYMKFEMYQQDTKAA